jgi:hypothetical protein
MDFHQFCEKNGITPPQLQHTQVYSLHDPTSWEKATQLINGGELVAFYNIHVAAILLDGSNEQALTKLSKFKGAIRKTMPLGCMMPWERIISPNPSESCIDLNNIPPDLSDIALDPQKMREQFKDTFVRFPINPKKIALVPSSMVSVSEDKIYYIQVWDPLSNPSVMKLLESIVTEYCIVAKTAVTSFNRHGEYERIDQIQAIREADTYRMPLFLFDPSKPAVIDKEHPHGPVGSYPIVQLTKTGVVQVR